MMGLNSSPLAFSTLSLGFLFGLSNMAIAKNPELEQNIFTNILIAFALMETFVFLNFVASGLVLFAY